MLWIQSEAKANILAPLDDIFAPLHLIPSSICSPMPYVCGSLLTQKYSGFQYLHVLSADMILGKPLRNGYAGNWNNLIGSWRFQVPIRDLVQHYCGGSDLALHIHVQLHPCQNHPDILFEITAQQKL